MAKAEAQLEGEQQPSLSSKRQIKNDKIKRQKHAREVWKDRGNLFGAGLFTHT